MNLEEHACYYMFSHVYIHGATRRHKNTQMQQKPIAQKSHGDESGLEYWLDLDGGHLA